MKMIRQIRTYYLLFVVILIGTGIHAQNNVSNQTKDQQAIKAMREGNNAYKKSGYADAEFKYRISATLADKNTDNAYNLGNAMLEQKRYKEAVAQYQKTLNTTKDEQLQAQAYYNMGNAFMGLKDYQNAVNHYKESLKRNPDDEQARYNYALAKKFLKENPPQQNQDQNQDEQEQDKEQQKEDQQDKQDQDKEQDKQDEQNKEDNKDDKKDQQDQDNEDQQNQDQDQQPDQNKDQQDQNKDQNPSDKNDKQPSSGDNQQKQPQPTQGKMSRQQMNQLLEALNNEEKKTQEKVNAQKGKARVIKKEKDW